MSAFPSATDIKLITTAKLEELKSGGDCGTLPSTEAIRQAWPKVLEAVAVSASECEDAVAALEYVYEFVLHPIAHGKGWASLSSDERGAYIATVSDKAGSFKEDVVKYMSNV